MWNEPRLACGHSEGSDCECNCLLECDKFSVVLNIPDVSKESDFSSLGNVLKCQPDLSAHIMGDGNLHPHVTFMFM